MLTPELVGGDTTELQRHLNDEPIALTMGVVKFTPEEEAIMSEAVPKDEILFKPGKKGPPQIYLSHPTYIRWFNRAFGRGQWGLMQLSKPQKAGTTILVPYALMVRGVALFSCYGAAEYFETNEQQTYDDVIESTHAYALRRFAKRLGIGLEMWDKAFINQILDSRGGNRSSGGSGRELEYEYHEPQRQQQPPRTPPPARQERPVASHPHEGAKITTDQVTRFWTIARKVGRTDEEVKAFLSTAYTLASSRDILRKDYDSIVRAIEHPGALTAPVRDRIPGEEG